MSLGQTKTLDSVLQNAHNIPSNTQITSQKHAETPAHNPQQQPFALLPTQILNHVSNNARQDISQIKQPSYALNPAI